MLVKRNISTSVVNSTPFLFFILLLLVLLVNSQIIYQDLMFPEQPMVYLMNQKIHSWSDLLAIYLHPQMLDWMNVPFFRPSGHFLIYQIISPWIGWHNTRGLLLVNFIFLALMGTMLIKVYELLFPRFKVGGYIAFAICVMHPLFLISRFTIMHFEYASIFFLLASLYCFIVFCKKNLPASPAVAIEQVKFNYFGWLFAAMLFYFVATTFKETTIMLLPVLLVYYLLRLYTQQTLSQFLQAVVRNKEVVQLFILLCAVGGLIAAYLSLAWVNSGGATFLPTHLQEILSVLNKYLKIIFSFPYNFIPGAKPRSTDVLWEISMFPWVSSVVMLVAMFLLPVITFKTFSAKTINPVENNKKTLIFLYLSAAIFLLLPILWNHAMPWHAALSLVFLSLLIGYAVEDLLQRYVAAPVARNVIAYGIALLIGVSTILVNQINFHYMFKHPLLFNYKLNRNAIKHPPLLARPLNNDSVVVVEDRLSQHNDYQRGDGVYPFVYLGQVDVHRLTKEIAMYKFPYVYGGTLFRWAYSNSNIKEQIYPFQVEMMRKIPDEEIIYNWLQHYNNIFCLGFDNQGRWHDQTPAFKQYLLLEQQARHIVVHHYQALSAIALSGKPLLFQRILLPDSMVCKQMCDKTQRCVGFTYVNETKNLEPATVCKMYQTLAVQHTKCAECTGFIKEKT